MILYKYYGYDSGLKAIKSRNLGFRKPKHFNDPFELSYLSNSDGNSSKITMLNTRLDQFRDSVAILSLTRTPDNPLMWAHYGEEHKGFVIGYDATDKFLSSQEYNLIPATSGDVVYTNTKSSHFLDQDTMRKVNEIYLSSLGRNNIKDPETVSLARKIFLTKHASWVYEEEVRVVKIIDSIFMESRDFQSDPLRSYSILLEENSSGFSKEKIPGLSIFNHISKIKEIYLGLRNPLIQSDKFDEIPRFDFPQIFTFQMNDRSWSLKRKKIVI